MTSLAPFAIGEVSIRQHDGLFSLNDLHKASGSVESQRPNQFLRIDQTKALIQELETAQICAVKTKEGRNGGTYACREIVIAYAAWISAAFHLKVIRVFLDVAAQTQPATITPAQQQHLKELVDLVVESGKQKSHAETWARLHRKFGVPRYTDLPAAQFDAACQYLLGKLDAPSIIAIIQKHLPAQRAHDAHRAAAEASKHIYSAVFDAVMNGDEHYARHRYLLKFAHDSQINPNLPIVVTMDDAAFIGTWDGITREVSKHGKWWSDTDLSAMIHACATQLASRNPGQRQPPALACG